MRSLDLRQLFRAAAAGSALLVSLSTATAGRMFPDEPSRPHIMAGSQPNWGYNQTCWQRFPPLPPCNSDGNCYGYGDPSQGSLGYEQQSHSYVPDSQLMQPSQSFSTLPGSVMPPGMNSMPYSPPAADSHQGGYSMPSAGPSTALPPVPEHFSNPSSEPLKTFQAPQSAPSFLPPLPGPIDAVPPIPGQSRVAPQRFMIEPNGKVAVTQNSMPSSKSSSSRYGQSVPSQMPVPQTAAPYQGMQISPMQFANSTNARPEAQAGQRYGQLPVNTVNSTTVPPRQSQTSIPVRAISQSRTTQSGSGARYGTVRPATSSAQQPLNLEPLRTTPGSLR